MLIPNFYPMKKIIVTLLSFTLVICCFAQKSGDPLRAFRYVTPNASNVTAFDLQKIGQWVEVKDWAQELRLRRLPSQKNGIPALKSNIYNILNDWANGGCKCGIDFQSVAVAARSTDSTGIHHYIYIPITNAKKLFKFLEVKPSKFSDATHTTYYYYWDNDGYALYSNDEVMVCDFYSLDMFFDVPSTPPTKEQLAEEIRNLEKTWSANAFVQRPHAAQFISQMQGIDVIKFQTHAPDLTLIGKAYDEISSVSNIIQSLYPTYIGHFTANDSEIRATIEFPDGAPLLLGPTTELPQELIQHTINNPNILMFCKLNSEDSISKEEIDAATQMICNILRMDSLPYTEAAPPQYVFSYNRENNTQCLSGFAPDSSKLANLLAEIIKRKQLGCVLSPNYELKNEISKERKMWNGFTRYDFHVATISTFTHYYYGDISVEPEYTIDSTCQPSIDYFYYWDPVVEEVKSVDDDGVTVIDESEMDVVVVEEERVEIPANSDSIRKVADSDTIETTKILLLKDNYFWFTDSETAANEIATLVPMNELQQKALNLRHYPLCIVGKDLGIFPNDSLDTEINDGIITIKYSTPSDGHNLLSRILRD